MNNLNELLTKHTPKPRRGLRKNFTKNITNYLHEHPKQSLFSSIKETLVMKHLAKPAMVVATLAILVGVGGTAYAAVGGWEGIQAIFGGQQKVTNARVVKVGTQNCTFINAFNIAEGSKQDSAYYYKIKDDSKLTNEQVVQMVKGNCQLDRGSKVGLDIATELAKDPLNKDATRGYYIDSEVTAVSSTSISLKSDIPYGPEMRTVSAAFPVSQNVIVFEGNSMLTLQDIKVGDHIAMTYRATGNALTNSETTWLGDIVASKQLVVTIGKNSKDLSASIDYQKYNGQEFEQVVPCGSEPSGYCNAEQYHTNKQNQ